MAYSSQGGIGVKISVYPLKELYFICHTFGFNFSKEQNDRLTGGTEGRIDTGTGSSQIWVVPTNEEEDVLRKKLHMW